MKPETIVRLLAEHFARRGQDLVAAYLFGSVARGEQRPDSDVDVGVVIGKRAIELQDLDRLGRLQEELAELLHREVDVVPLDLASPDFRHQVLQDGVVLHGEDSPVRIEWEIQSRNEYFDLLPHLIAYRRAAMERA